MEVLFIATGMWVTVVFLSTWIPKTWKQRAVGAGALTDILIHVVLQTLFGGTGAERVGLLMAGVMLNVTMHSYKALYGSISLTGTYRPGRFCKGFEEPVQAPENIQFGGDKYMNDIWNKY